MECRRDYNQTICTCPKTECERHGFCCSCMQKHMSNRQLPSCYFAGTDATDKSFETFAKLVNQKKI